MQQVLVSIQDDVKLRLKASFDDYLRAQEIPQSTLLDAMRYSLLNGGKRMRPLLANIVGRMLNAAQVDIDLIALALECIHAYSLVHDDLPCMDDDSLRRGEPTCHIKFDEATAVLAGDALQSTAFEALASLPMSEFGNAKRTQLILELAKASGVQGMCLGQSLDLIATDKNIDLESLKHLHQLKTGALLTASVRMVAMASEKTSASDLTHLSDFAMHIGLAFQIQDDILDVTADTATLGKQQGSDKANNKSTFVSQLDLDGAKTTLKEHHQHAIDALNDLEYDTEILKIFTDYMITRTF